MKRLLRARSRPKARSAANFRGDIQGLRAVAVLLVIADHVLGEPAGGFVGVDIFFVVSGFLITSLLLGEHDRLGKISYLNFYRRRVRRIVPVAVLVLSVTIAATYILFSTARGDGVREDGVWALLFAANWHFADIGTDYFGDNVLVSPLQHYWSLAVEEQFYVVWPTLVVVIMAVGATRMRRARTTTPHGRSHASIGGAASTATQPHFGLLALSLMVVTLSAGYSYYHSVEAPTAAYFSTFDRAWELALGATIATLAPWLVRTPQLLRYLLTTLGLSMIGVSAVMINDTLTFPMPWAALPVIGAALVVSAGVGVNLKFPLLVNPVTRYLGDISYSLYLWHFPVAVLAVAYFPEKGLAYQGTALAATLALSIFTFHMVENPVRRSNWLEPRWRRARVRGPADHSHPVANGWLATGLLAAIVLSALAVQQPDAGLETPLLAAQPAGTSATTSPIEIGGDAATDDEEYLQERVLQSLRLERFPDFEPTVDSLGLPRWFEDLQSYGCVDVGPPNVDECRFGNPKPGFSAVVVGDSYAMAYMPAVRTALESQFVVQQLTRQQCPAFQAPTTTFSGAAYPECTDFKDFAVDEIERLNPDVVILSSSFGYALSGLASGATGGAAISEIERGLVQFQRAVAKPGRLVVELAPPPGSKALQACVTSVGSPDDCEQDASSTWVDYTEMQRRVSERTGATYIDTIDWFCYDEHCPAFVGPTPVYADGLHLTLAFSKQLGPVMQSALLQAATRAELTARPKGSRKGQSRGGPS